MLTLSQSGRIFDQRMMQQRPIPQWHHAPSYCQVALLSLNQPAPRGLYGRIPVQTPRVTMFAAPSYRATPVMQPPSFGAILQGYLDNINHELAFPRQPVSPTFRDLFDKTRAFAKNPRFRRAGPTTSPDPTAPGRATSQIHRATREICTDLYAQS